MTSNINLDKIQPCARLCHIIKWDDFDGYGFNLHAEKGKNGQFIGKVDEGSPSEAAGLRQGDRIIEVNEINISNETHKQVVERIKAFPSETKLLVVDQLADDYYKLNNIVIKGSMNGVKYVKTPERNPAAKDDDDDDFVVDDNIDGLLNKRQQPIMSTFKPTSNGNNQVTSNDTHSIASSSDGNNSHKENGNGSTSVTRIDSNDDDNISSKSSSSGSKDQTSTNGTSTTTTTTTTGGLNLQMSAKELRAKLAARKKYDPKKESIGFKDKFDIVQKL